MDPGFGSQDEPRGREGGDRRQREERQKWRLAARTALRRDPGLGPNLRHRSCESRSAVTVNCATPEERSHRTYALEVPDSAFVRVSPRRS